MKHLLIATGLILSFGIQGAHAFDTKAAAKSASKTSATKVAPKTQSVEVDAAASKVKWLGKKVTGQHNGTIALKAGYLNVEVDKIVGGEFEIDMTSLVDEDLKDAEYNKKLVGHLKSEDFFDVAKFPTSKFVIKSVKAVSGNPKVTHDLTGDLTIKNETHELVVPAKIEKKGAKWEGDATVVVDRTKWNVRYGSGKFFTGLGDKMIYDDFTLEIKVVTK